jgi:hypothetical protein
MTFAIEITRREYDTDNYADGDRGPCLREQDDSREYGDAYDTEDIYGERKLTPVEWATNKLRPYAEFEPSVYPIPPEVGESTWLCAIDADPYTSVETEITAYLTGEWTEMQRSEVFRAVTNREAPAGYPF